MNEVVQKLVSNIVEENKELINAPQHNFSQLVPSLIQKGIDNLDLSMFSPEMKKELLNVLGKEYLRRGNLTEATKAFVLTNDTLSLIHI